MNATVELVHALSPRELVELSELLIRTVEAGHSVGYLRPPSLEEATAYWDGVPSSSTRLLLAKAGGRVVGTVQLELAARENGRHRAAVNKLLVHPDWQGRGIGRLLMTEIEALARREGRTLLHLDTEAGSPATAFYARLGWTEAGTIPRWALSPHGGEPRGTTFYYKLLG